MRRTRLTWTAPVSLAAACLFLARCDLGEDANLGDDSSRLNERDGGGQTCGDAICGAGEYCCNESCSLCAKEGDGCRTLLCNEDGEDPEYDPCDGKACGDPCLLCPPNDPDCAETADLKSCNERGICVGGRDPAPRCGGDPPEQCGSTTCAEGEYCCNESCGTCAKEGEGCTLQLCDPGYDPCDGKACGDPCSPCAPDDTDCAETADLKFCNERGICVGGRDPAPRCEEKEPALCAGPNPAQGCDDGCPAGTTCDRDACRPSACGCDETTGYWQCTADCGEGGVCVAVAEDRCTTPNPADGCDDGCPNGTTCDRQACRPFECSCDGTTGGWICTDDCGSGGYCVPNP